jgi:hypothetical protein
MKLEADLKCPNCRRSFKQRVEDMRPGKSRTCPGCGTTIAFTGDDGREAQRALDRLQRSLSKTIKLNIRL